MKQERPIVFAYHDHVIFIKKMIDYKKSMDKSLNMKVISKHLGITASYLSMILNEKREVNSELAMKMADCFNLENGEKTFFELLVQFNNSKSDEIKSQFFERMNSFKKYKELNKMETVIHNYFSNWLHIVIREMTSLDDFCDDAKWIQERIKFPVKVSEIKLSLEFLVLNEIIIKNEDGTYCKPDHQISCTDKVFSNALARFHREFLQLAGDSIIQASADERLLLGHCTALSKENYGEAEKILKDAYEKIRKLQTKNDANDSVYFVEFALFPLTEGE